MFMEERKSDGIPSATGSVDELGFFGAWGAKHHQNVLTDLPLSEDFAVQKTIGDILGEEGDLAWYQDSFDYQDMVNIDKNWDKGLYAVDDEGKVIGGDNYNPSDIAITPGYVLKTDPKVAMWLKLKSKGYTPEKIKEMTLNQTREIWKKNQRDLGAYDDTNWPGASGLAEFGGGITAWLNDPINTAGLAAEIALFKGGGPKGTLTEGAGKKNIGEFLTEVGKKLEPLIKQYPRGTAKGNSTIADMVAGSPDIRKLDWIQKFKKKEIYETMDDLNKFLINTKKNSPNITVEEVIKLVRDKKDIFKNPRTSELLDEAMKKDLVKEVFAFAAVSGFMGAATEAAHQIGTFDFKSDVLSGKGMPKYGKSEADKDVMLSGAFGFIFGGLFSLGSNILDKRGEDLIPFGGTGSAKEKSVDDIYQSMSDIENSKNADGSTPEVETFNTDDIPDFEKKSQEAIDEIEASEVSEDFNEYNINKTEQDKWQLIQDCLLSL